MTAILGNIVRVQPRTFLKDINIFKVTSHYVRRIIWVFLLLLVSQFLLIAPAFAQASMPSALPTLTPSPYTLPPSISPTSPLYTDLLLNNMFHSFSCLAVGQSVIGQPCLTYQVTKNAEGMIQSVPVLSSVNLSGGTLGAVTSLIGGLYMNPPVRTADYLASVGQGLGIVKEAQAQVGGSGAAVLSPILKLWQVSRNVSYVVMIIIFLVIGLMIMFRNRINPQTVITAQAALPGLVIGLILITFSYFLAGLISDMAFVGTNIVGYYFSAASGQTSPQNLVEVTKDKNILSIFSPITAILDNQKIADALAAIWPFLENPNRSNIPLAPNFLDPSRAITALAAMLVTQLVMPFGNMGGGIGQIIVSVVGGGYTLLNPRGTVSFALAFVAIIVLIYAMFRLLLRLINNYITIIFLTLTAPFQFLAASLPGRQGIATNWILNMLANILAFPAVLAVLYFVAFLIPSDFAKPPLSDIFKVSQSQEITGTATFPLFGGMDLSFIKILLAFGALVALPSVPDIINRTIGRLGVAGQLIGQEIGAGVGAGRGYAGQFQGGVSGLAGQAGRLTDTTNIQYAYDPTINPRTSRPVGWVSSRIAQPGQLARARFGWGSFWSTGLGGRARRRFGI